MTIAAIMLISAAVAPTLQDITQLPPAAAGDLALQEQQHGPIVEVVEVQNRPLQPPRTARLEFVEQAMPSELGCIRKRWTATFLHDEGAALGDATLNQVFSSTEIKLSDSPSCPVGQYAHLNPGIAPEEGFAVLVQLERIRSGSRRARFACSDQTSTNLCASRKVIRRELSALTPWGVSRHDGVIELWLGTPGQVVTKVRFGPTENDGIEVARIIPAPA